MSTHKRIPDDQPEPQPWRTAEDAEGWNVVARGRRSSRQPPLIRVVVDLDAEQSAWVRAEAERTGLDYVTIVRQLVEEKRLEAPPIANRRSA